MARLAAFARVCFLAGALLAAPCLSSNAGARATDAATSAASLLQCAQAAMGGAALRDLTATRLHGVSMRFAIEQPERPEGPYPLDVADFDQIRDFAQGRTRAEMRTRGLSTAWYVRDEWRPSLVITDRDAAAVQRGDKFVPGRAVQVFDANEALALGPERLLDTAQHASDLRLGAAETVHGTRHGVLQFSWEARKVRVFVHLESCLPQQVEITRARPFDLYWGAWGEVRSLVEYAQWTLEPNGVRFPRHWRVTSNGLPDQEVMVDRVEFDPALESSWWEPLATQRSPNRRIDELHHDPARTTEVAPGVRLLSGAWNVVEIETADGIWIGDGPISNGYSDSILAEIRARHPGAKLRGVISTSDSWPHIGGLRRYASERVPIYALDSNLPLVQRLLQVAPAIQTPALVAIKARTSFGSGAQRFDAIPFRTITGERQIALWFPAAKLLYASDLITVAQDGSVFLPQSLSELRAVIDREGLDVQRVMGMHFDAIEWQTLLSRPSRS